MVWQGAGATGVAAGFFVSGAGEREVERETEGQGARQRGEGRKRAERCGYDEPREKKSIERHPGGRVQVRRVRKDGWTGARRQLFLDRLAATCCVGEALAATGLAASSLYRLRKRDLDFAEAWDDAVAAHFDDVELGLLRYSKQALRGHGAENGKALGEARARAAANPDFALDLLKMRRAGDARVAGGGTRQRIGGRVKAADKEELAKAIMKLVRAVKKRSGTAE